MEPTDDPANPNRLTRDVAPERYRLDIETDLEASSFRGTVSIDATVHTATARVVCNASELTITSATLSVGERTLVPTWELDEATERLVLDAGETLPVGPLTIELAFDGVLNEQLVGFYRSSYDVDGVTKHLAVTQFEAPYARKAFPCWDEPAFKATFEIGLTCGAGLLAVSNSAETARTTLPDGRVRFAFAPTMTMSTYLVAWVIGELVVTEPVRGGSTDIRVIHRPGRDGLTAFALDCAAHAVAWFEEYYGIDYPGDKLDLIAVPDFAFGAMENLGCVTFRENLLLADPDRSNRAELERAATVIEHEIAHMWFGDLVTMSWWNGIWLNEAFATFMEFSCADSYRPDWDIWTSFGLSKSQAFDTDALGSTRPIEYRVDTPADAEGMFDILTYEKGASVLRMFEQWAGPERFRDGVRAYLARHAYANTETPDLWDALGETSGVDVTAMMSTWIFQGGHPVVTVAPTDRGVRLRQDRMRYAGGSAAADTSWIVPIRLRALVEGSVVERSVLLDGETLDVDLGGTVTWVDANDGFTGFYRTAYDPGLRDRLLAVVADLPSIDRYALVDDAAALFLADRADVSAVLATVRAVAAVEDEPSVWRRIAGVMSGLSALCAPEDRDAIRDTVRAITARIDLGLDVKPEDPDLHAVVLRLAGGVGADEQVIDAARARYAARTTTDEPDLAAAVLDVVAMNGDAAAFDEILADYRSADTPQAELRALYALSLVPDASTTQRLCEMCATEVRTQNAPFVLAQGMSNPATGPDVWRFVAANWDALVDRFPSSSIGRMAGGIRNFADADLAAAISAFFETHEVPGGAQSLAQHLERLAVNVAARPRLTEQIAALPD